MKRRLKRSRIFLKKEINPQMALREMTRAEEKLAQANFQAALRKI